MRSSSTLQKHSRLFHRFALPLAFGVICCPPAVIRAQEVEHNPSQSATCCDDSKGQLLLGEIEWSGQTFGTRPMITGPVAKAWLSQGVDRTDELLALLDSPDSFAAAHIVLTELWRAPRREEFWISTTYGYFVGHNGLYLLVEWRKTDGKFDKSVTVLDRECQQKRLRDWWKARYRDYPLEFSTKTPQQTPDTRENARKHKLSDDIDWSGPISGEVRLTINAAHKLRSLGIDSCEEIFPLLDDLDSYVAAHVVLTELWRIPHHRKRIRSTPIRAGFFVLQNGLHVRVEWKDVDGTITKVVTVPDEECQRKRLSQWWRERFRNHPQEFSSKTEIN